MNIQYKKTTKLSSSLIYSWNDGWMEGWMDTVDGWMRLWMDR